MPFRRSEGANPVLDKSLSHMLEVETINLVSMYERRNDESVALSPYTALFTIDK